jgi:hypothetical protein
MNAIIPFMNTAEMAVKIVPRSDEPCTVVSFGDRIRYKQYQPTTRSRDLNAAKIREILFRNPVEQGGSRIGRELHR